MALVIIICLIVWWKKKQIAQVATLQQFNNMNNTNDNGGTTIILAKNTPQPAYGMDQPMAPYSQPMAVNPPTYQPFYQPAFQSIQPVYSQPFQAGYGLGIQPQGPGPIY